MWRLAVGVVRSALGLMVCGVASALGQDTTATKPDDGKVKVEFGVSIVADFYYNSARPAGPGVPFYLTPASPFGLSQNTFDANARATMLSVRVSGARVGSFDVSGRVQAFLFDPAVLNDKYGILPFAAAAQLENDDWLFAAGLQLQIFNPLMPNTLTWSKLGGSGNAGAGVIGQARVQRDFHPSDKSHVFLTFGFSEPIATTFTDDVTGREDNGWPNLEGRAVLALGQQLQDEGPRAKRSFELAFSGLVGQIRQTSPGGNRVVTDVTGFGSDLQWAITPRWGVMGEAFVGQTLGVWTGGVLQNINPATFAGIGASGGWGEVSYYISPKTLHTHWGYGLDDADNDDLATGQKTRNETYYANLVWDVTEAARFGWEFTYRKTSHVGLGTNSGIGLHAHVRYKL